MPSFDIVCLANSYKHILSRCVAGLKTDGGGWLRPVSEAGEGELLQVQCALAGNGQPQVLDAIRIGVVEPRPTPYQPENWLVSSDRWQLIQRPATTVQARIVAASVFRGALLFGSTKDRVQRTVFDRTPAAESLVLVDPAEVRWHTRVNWGKKQARVQFRLVNTWYNLALTDPMYAGKLRQLEAGDHALHEIGIAKGRSPLLTISLTAPFNDGCCYKLVAAVVSLPDSWLRFF